MKKKVHAPYVTLKRALAEGHDKVSVIRLLRQIDQTQAELRDKVRAL